MNDIVILSVVIAAVVLLFAFVFVSYAYHRHRRRQMQVTAEKSPFKPSYDVKPNSGVDLLGNIIGPAASPVTPTEFFSAGRVCLAITILKNLIIFYYWFRFPHHCINALFFSRLLSLIASSSKRNSISSFNVL